MKEQIEKLQDWFEKLPYWLARPFQIILWKLWIRNLKDYSVQTEEREMKKMDAQDTLKERRNDY